MDAENTSVVSLAWIAFFPSAKFYYLLQSEQGFLAPSLKPYFKFHLLHNNFSDSSPVYLIKYSCAQSQHTQHTLTCCLFLFFYFFNFWLCWVFVAVCGLSLVAASRGYSSLRCTGFSLQWLLLLQSTGSRHTGFSSCGTWAQ